MKDKFTVVVAVALIQLIFFGLYMNSEMSIKVSEVSVNKAATVCGDGFVNIRPYRAMSDGLYIETLCKDGRKLRVRIQ